MLDAISIALALAVLIVCVYLIGHVQGVASTERRLMNERKFKEYVDDVLKPDPSYSGMLRRDPVLTLLTQLTEEKNAQIAELRRIIKEKDRTTYLVPGMPTTFVNEKKDDEK